MTLATVQAVAELSELIDSFGDTSYKCAQHKVNTGAVIASRAKVGIGVKQLMDAVRKEPQPSGDYQTYGMLYQAARLVVDTWRTGAHELTEEFGDLQLVLLALERVVNESPPILDSRRQAIIGEAISQAIDEFKGGY